jgi:glucose-6-phosphate isomerase
MTAPPAFPVTARSLTKSFEAACARLDALGFAEALWRRRLEVWSGDAEAQRLIGNRLGWLQATAFAASQVPRLRACADSVKQEGFTDVVLLGMGGSSLAPAVLADVCGTAPGSPRFRVLDSVDPDAVRSAMDRAATTLFVLASKSGTTIEPNAMAEEARRRVISHGHESWGRRFVAITDENTALHRRAAVERFRDVFVNPADIGGRYSALSLFGMVPAALMGIDVEALLAGARGMEAACRVPRAKDNPGLALGAFIGAGVLAGRDKLTLRLPRELQSFGLWVEQLVAESTGKQGTGVVPVSGESRDTKLGPDRLVVTISLATSPPRDGGLDPDVPYMSLGMPNPEALGAEFFRWEVATATAGLLLGVNPFDEPNVQQAKSATGALLDAYRQRRELPSPEPHADLDGIAVTLSEPARAALSPHPIQSFLRLAHGTDYVAVLSYLPPDDPAWDEALQRFRAGVTARTGCAATTGYGPRYLHSTGQLHKGGPASGVFVIVTANPHEDLAVPNEPFSFGVLETAQALGDFASLERTGRRVLLARLPRRDIGMFREFCGTLLATG